MPPVDTDSYSVPLAVFGGPEGWKSALFDYENMEFVCVDGETLKEAYWFECPFGRAAIEENTEEIREAGDIEEFLEAVFAGRKARSSDYNVIILSDLKK